MSDLKAMSDAEVMAAAGLSKMSDEEVLAAAGVQKAATDGPDKTAAFGQGLAQGGTFGYANEAQAATAPLVKGAMKLFGMDTGGEADEKLKAQGFKINAPEDSYKTRLADNKVRDKELQKSGLYTAGKIAGSLIPASRMAKLLSAPVTGLGKLAQATGTGALTGAIENTEGGLEARAENALWGGGLGAVGQGLTSGLGKLGTGVKSLLSDASGVSPKQIETYLKDPKIIDDLTKKYGGDTQLAVDAFRDAANKTIGAAKNRLGKSIEDAIVAVEKNAPSTGVQAKPILQTIESFAQRLDPSLPHDMKILKEIGDLNAEIMSVADTQTGTIGIRSLNRLKNALQEMAAPSYTKEGQIFAKGKDTQQAAKAAAAKVRELLNDAVPQIKDANAKLSRLHVIESKMNRNMLTTEKPIGSVIQAGKGAGAPSKWLSRLEEATGEKLLPQAENLAAMEAFGNPSLVPQGSTGLTLTRAGLGGLAGYAGAETTGNNPWAGAAIGSAASSPAALKLMLKGASKTKLPAAYGALKQGLDSIPAAALGSAAANLNPWRQE